MSLYKRGEIYWSRIERNGRVFQRSTRVRNKNVATRIESAWRTNEALAEAGLSASDRKMSLLNFENRFFSYLSAHVGKSTLQFYKTAWVPISYSGSLYMHPMDQIDPAVIDGFVQRRIVQGVKPATVNNSLKTLRRALHLAVEWRLLQRVPKIRLLIGERIREFVISEELLATMVGNVAPVMKQLLPFLVDTGLRISEAVDLTWDNVSLEPREGMARGWVFITKGKSKAAVRTVPLTARAAVILAERKAAAGVSSYVWTLKHERRLNRTYASRMFHKVTEELNMPWDCVLHSTRHTFCTKLGLAGADAFTIKALAGHSSITISQRYVHSTQIAAERAISMMETAIKS